MLNAYRNECSVLRLRGLGWSPKSMIKLNKSEYVKVVRDSPVRRKKSMVRLPKMLNKSCDGIAMKKCCIMRRNHFLYNRMYDKDSEAFKSFRIVLGRLFRIRFEGL